MKQVVVQCSVPADDIAPFPPLAVARRIIHTHRSSPFPQSCHHAQQILQQCVGLKAANSSPSSPPPPPLIINHTCPNSPVTMQQQVSICDATPSTELNESNVSSPKIAGSNTKNQPHTSPHSPSSNVDLARQASFSSHFTDEPHRISLQASSPDPMSPSVSKVLQTRKCSPSRCSILNSLAAAAEDGVALASELVYNLKGSLYSILPHSLRGKVSDDWDSMLSSSLLEHFMGRLDGNIQGTSSWLTNPSSFKRVIKKVSGNVAANANALRKRHHSIEDLLSTIESYERAGLISDLESFGFSEEAWFLQDRCVLYALFARFRTLQEALNLLCFMRLETRLPFHDTWSFACSDDRCRNYLKKIRDICGFDDKIKTFAWKLDKLELCALEVDPCEAKSRHDARSICDRLMKFIDSPLGLELKKIRVVSYLDTAVRLLLHHADIFEVCSRRPWVG